VLSADNVDEPPQLGAIVRGAKMTSSPSGQEIAFTILREFERAQSELLGKAVVLSDGKAGVIEKIFLDELHGLRIAVKGHKGKWPISTVKFAE
jgi:hypothetical protein